MEACSAAQAATMRMNTCDVNAIILGELGVTPLGGRSAVVVDLCATVTSAVEAVIGEMGGFVSGRQTWHRLMR